ncbi:MAG: S1 RNA-binding domain-containing protein, partial [bacterium]
MSENLTREFSTPGIDQSEEAEVEVREVGESFSDQFETEEFEIEEVRSPEELRDQEYTLEERQFWQEKYLSTVKSYKVGELVKGRIVAMSDKEVTIDIGFKSEGTVPITEFLHPEEVKVGDEVEVYIESVEGREGSVILSRQKAEFMRAWEKIQELYRSGERIEGKILRRVKGGMVVEILGV